MITPYLLYEDVAGAIKFLSKAFGFRKSGSTMSDKNGKLTHAAMKLGGDLIMMGDPGPRYKNPKKLGEATQMLYVKVNDADKHFARARKAGAKIL
jgi:PhnB protein